MIASSPMGEIASRTIRLRSVFKVKDWELRCASHPALPDCSDPDPRPGGAPLTHRPLSLSSDRGVRVPNALRKSAELSGAHGDTPATRCRDFPDRTTLFLVPGEPQHCRAPGRQRGPNPGGLCPIPSG